MINKRIDNLMFCIPFRPPSYRLYNKLLIPFKEIKLWDEWQNGTIILKTVNGENLFIEIGLCTIYFNKNLFNIIRGDSPNLFLASKLEFWIKYSTSLFRPFSRATEWI
jgi:hypothetical protein